MDNFIIRFFRGVFNSFRIGYKVGRHDFLTWFEMLRFNTIKENSLNHKILLMGFHMGRMIGDKRDVSRIR